MQAVHQDHPDLSVVLRMSLSLWTALLTQPPNLPAAVGCLLGDARVDRQGIMVCWSVWSGALLFDILHSHKRLSGSSMPVIYGDTVTVWCHMPVASMRWRHNTLAFWLVRSRCIMNHVRLTCVFVFSFFKGRCSRCCCWSVFVGFIRWAYAALIYPRHNRHMTDSSSLLVRLIRTKHMCLYRTGQLKATRLHSNSCFNPPHWCLSNHPPTKIFRLTGRVEKCDREIGTQWLFSRIAYSNSSVNPCQNKDILKKQIARQP